MPQTIDRDFDVVVTDTDDQTVALVEVKARPVSDWREALGPRTARLPEPVAFILAVDPSNILIFRGEQGSLGECLGSLDSREILSFYDPGFSGRRVFHPYLIGVTQLSRKSSGNQGLWNPPCLNRHSP